MTHFQYKTSGTCSRLIDFELDDENKVRNVSFVGGCNGNLKAISRLCEGHPASEIAELLKGVDCGGKGTSCGDQFSKALEEALKQV